jgi:hypothetical protein
MTCPVIDNPTDCKVCAVIRLLQAENVNSDEIHRELCADYGQNARSEGKV